MLKPMWQPMLQPPALPALLAYSPLQLSCVIYAAAAATAQVKSNTKKLRTTDSATDTIANQFITDASAGACLETLRRDIRSRSLLSCPPPPVSTSRGDSGHTRPIEQPKGKGPLQSGYRSDVQRRFVCAHLARTVEIRSPQYVLSVDAVRKPFWVARSRTRWS